MAAILSMERWVNFYNTPHDDVIKWKHFPRYCAGNSPVPGEFAAQRPVTQSFDAFFDLRLNKRLSKQSLGWWFETLSYPLWRHCNEININTAYPIRYVLLWLVLADLGHTLHGIMQSRYTAVIFLPITHERQPIARRKGEIWRVERGCKVWLKFYDCNCCAVCTVELYMAAIYR